MSQTVEEISVKLLPIIGKTFTLPTIKNKGRIGQFLETLLGIPHTSNCLDCLDGELKTFPIKELKNKKIVPKETICVTMLSEDELRTNNFKSSKCYKKMNKMLVVPYYRNGDKIAFTTPKIIQLESDYPELYIQIVSDYNEIQKNFIENGILQSKTGKLLQNRTKGAKNTITRAFYLRPEFMKQTIPLSMPTITEPAITESSPLEIEIVISPLNNSV
jgi:DNA mismatch repair protein MutH